MAFLGKEQSSEVNSTVIPLPYKQRSAPLEAQTETKDKGKCQRTELTFQLTNWPFASAWEIYNVCLFAWTLDQNANDLAAGHAADDATVAPSRRQGLAKLSRSEVLNSKQLFLIMLLAKSESEVFALQLGLSLGLWLWLGRWPCNPWGVLFVDHYPWSDQKFLSLRSLIICTVHLRTMRYGATSDFLQHARPPKPIPSRATTSHLL